MQILNTLQERHRYNMVHPRWATPTQKLSVLYYYTIQQNKGIQPAATPLHFLFSLSQSLSHNHRDCFTIHSHITMLSFYRGITMGKYYGSPNRLSCWTLYNTTRKHTFYVGNFWCMKKIAGVSERIRQNKSPKESKQNK